MRCLPVCVLTCVFVLSRATFPRKCPTSWILNFLQRLYCRSPENFEFRPIEAVRPFGSRPPLPADRAWPTSWTLFNSICHFFACAFSAATSSFSPLPLWKLPIRASWEFILPSISLFLFIEHRVNALSSSRGPFLRIFFPPFFACIRRSLSLSSSYLQAPFP